MSLSAARRHAASRSAAKRLLRHLLQQEVRLCSVDFAVCSPARVLLQLLVASRSAAKTACCDPKCCETSLLRAQVLRDGLCTQVLRTSSAANRNDCEPTCGTCCSKPRCTPVLDFLEDLCSLRVCLYKAEKSCGGCCETACCEPACCEADMQSRTGCDSGCNGGTDCLTGTYAKVKAAPKAAPKEKAAPLPKAPKADSSASLRRTGRYYQASRVVVRN